jgi:hypothetical protein
MCSAHLRNQMMRYVISISMVQISVFDRLSRLFFRCRSHPNLRVHFKIPGNISKSTVLRKMQQSSISGNFEVYPRIRMAAASKKQSGNTVKD